jgi:glycerophosphoryl diester phosphodiesterase
MGQDNNNNSGIGILLCHGYLSCKTQMEPLELHLKKLGFQTQSVCLYGHGTDPRDLNKVLWEYWLKNVEDGYHSIRKRCKKLFVIGFSMGGCLSLILSSAKENKIDGLVIINPCMGIKDRFSFMVPYAVKWNNMVIRRGWNSLAIKYVDSETELPSINYKRNSLHGTNELKKLMVKCWESLDTVLTPCLVIQERDDPTVLYKSGERAFNKISSTSRQFISTNLGVHATMYLECCRNVIFEMVDKFIEDTRTSEFMTIAHRGASGNFTENTLTSFEEAINRGCDMIELDVQKIGSEYRVFHDYDFKRMFGLGVHTKDISEDVVSKLVYPNLDKIPTLTEVLDAINGRVPVNIEIKGPHIATSVASIATNYLEKPEWERVDIILSSFSCGELNLLRNAFPKLSLSLLVHDDKCDNLDMGIHFAAAKSSNFHSLNLPPAGVSVEVMELAKKEDIKIYVYTLNKLDDIRKMREMGVDGVFTDYPELIR